MSSYQRYPKYRNNCSPEQWFLRHHNKREKNNFKQQLNRWKKDPSYEIIPQVRRRSATWDWN